PEKFAAAAVLCLLVAGCAGAPGIERERDALLQRDRDWAAVATDGKNLERIVEFWTDDAVVIPAGAPVVRGKAAIREYVRTSLAIPGFKIRWNPRDASVSADGSLGYTTGENAVTLPGPDGKPMTIPGHYAAVWRREPSGEWRCTVDIWNNGP
ncbi:MAG: DUF4440 domain-containing protein, partial [Casimicrobiaceae bacterium]